jgi:hypothetical protein
VVGWKYQLFLDDCCGGEEVVDGQGNGESNYHIFETFYLCPTPQASLLNPKHRYIFRHCIRKALSVHYSMDICGSFPYMVILSRREYDWDPSIPKNVDEISLSCS